MAVNRLTGILHVTNLDAGFSGARKIVEVRIETCCVDSIGVTKVEQ